MNNSVISRSNSERLSRSVRMMFRAVRPRRDALVLPSIQQTSRGYEYHVYYPRGKALRTILLIYGMSIDGHNDFRLVKFARACADAGLKVVIPELPGLMNFRFAHEDLHRLIDVTNDVAKDRREELGLIGFST